MRPARCFSIIQLSNSRDCEEELIQKFLEKKQYDPEQTDWKEKQKICQSLARKGFPISKIKRLMDLT